MPTGDRQQLYDRAERALTVPMLVLALLIIPILLIPFVWTDMPHGARTALTAADLFIWVAFAFEYLLLLVLAVDRRRYVRTHLLELALVALPMLRPLRIARVARASRLVRAGVAVGAVSSLSRRRLAVTAAVYAPLAAVALALLASVLILDAERDHAGANIKTFGDALWWSVTTITTVGYGDRYPTTPEGRAVAAGLMIVGIALLGIITATIAAAFVRWSEAGAEEEVAVEHAEQDVALADVLAEVKALRAEVAELRERG